MRFLIFCSILISLFSCGTSAKTSNSTASAWTKQGCSLERLEYQEVTDTIHRTRNGKIEGGVSANGKAIISDQINVDSVKAYLNAGNKVFVSQTTFRTVKVDQKFYQDYTNNRSFLCQTLELMKLRGRKAVMPETRARAEKIYLDIIEMNSGLNNKNSGTIEKKNG